MRRIGIAIVLLLVATLAIGCALNTNSTKGSVTGFLINTPFGQIGAGGIEFHTLYTDLENERLQIYDANYYDADASMLPGIDPAVTDAAVNQHMQREYRVDLFPVMDEVEEEE
jgi:hypothetical protein